MLLVNAAAYHIHLAEVNNLAPSSIRQYQQVHSIVLRYMVLRCKRQPLLADLTRDAIRDFQVWLKHEHVARRYGGIEIQPGASTVRYYVKVIKTWVNTLFKDTPELFPEGNPTASIRLPKVAQKLPETFSDDEFRLLLAAATQTDQIRRNVAIMRVLGDTGVRVSELCRLAVDAIRFVSPPPSDASGIAAGSIRVMGKGSKEGDVVFGMSTKRALLDYVKHDRRPYAGEAELFLSKQGRPLAPQAIRKMMRRLAVLAHLTGIRMNPHKVRHSTGTWMAADGMNAFLIQKQLRHATVLQSQRYVTLAAQDLANAYRSPVEKRSRGRS